MLSPGSLPHFTWKSISLVFNHLSFKNKKQNENLFNISWSISTTFSTAQVGAHSRQSASTVLPSLDRKQQLTATEWSWCRQSYSCSCTSSVCLETNYPFQVFCAETTLKSASSTRPPARLFWSIFLTYLNHMKFDGNLQYVFKDILKTSEKTFHEIHFTGISPQICIQYA